MSKKSKRNKNRKNKVAAKVSTAVRDATEIVEVSMLPTIDAPAKHQGLRIVKPVTNPILGYTYGFGRDAFTPTEYDLAEIGRIEDVENMVRQAFKKKVGLMFKEGYDFVGPNKTTVQYVKKRLKQIEQASEMSTQILLRTIGADLIRLSNAFIFKSRSKKASGGKVRKAGTKSLDPVAAYFPIPAETIEIKRNKNTQRIEKYRQHMPDGRTQEFNPEDVIHIYYDRRPGFNTGKPTIVPVVDDIRALRRIEQNIELLIYQHLFPLFHHKVGTKEQPAQVYHDGTKEVDDVRDDIELMPTEGSIVTTHRHEIKAIGAESRAIRAEGYLDHFKKRVVAGLGISGVDLGEGETANRATSETMSRAMIDEVKDFQQILVTFLNNEVLEELLLEGQFSFDPLEVDNRVWLKFHEIDIDAKIKRENHNILMYQGHAISETELRNEIGREPIVDGERTGMFLDIVVKKQAEFSSLGAAPGSGAASQAQSRQQPSNQHGTKSGPEKKKSSFIPKAAVRDGILKKEFQDVISDIERLALSGSFSADWAVQLLSTVETRMVELLQSSMNKSVRQGVRAVGDPSEVELFSAYRSVEEYANLRVNSIINIVKKIVQGFDQYSPTIIDDVQKIYKSLSFRFDFILVTEERRSFLYGKALAYKQQGKATVSVDIIEDACENCQKQKDTTIDLAHVRIGDMPIAHDNCNCDIVPEKK